MSVDAILSVLQHSTKPLDRSLLLPGDADFISKLTLGQIIKGKVLRHLEGSRYTVAFGSDEKVVDSAVPLRSGELLYGKVTALDDYVRLRRIYPDESLALQQNVDAVPGRQQWSALSGKDVLTELLQQYRATLNSAESSLLRHMASSLPDLKVLAMSGLILHKLGLKISSEWLRSLYQIIHDHKLLAWDIDSDRVPRLEIGHMTAAVPDKNVVTALAAFISSLSKQKAKNGLDGTNMQHINDPIEQDMIDYARSNPSLPDEQLFRQEKENAHRYLGEQLLNVQNESSVAHRLMNIPMWFGDQLVEIQLALFSQRDEVTAESSCLRHRKLAFSLDTEALGRVEMVAYIVEHRLKLSVAVESTEKVKFIAAYLLELKTELKNNGWHLDEIDYRLSSDVPHNTMRSVVEHYITPDSLSCLI